MNDAIYKLVYCSRNQIRGTPEEIIREIRIILKSAHRNNPPAGVTGALLFNEGLFAQVLEGPVDSVSRIFETIQCDGRHSDVTVLQNGPAEHRDFPEWSMARVAPPQETNSASIAVALDTTLLHPAASADEVLGLLRSLVIQED